MKEVLAVAALDDVEDSGTLAAVHGLKPAARAAIARMARTIKTAGWDINGEMRQRGRESIHVQVTADSADRIVRAVGMNTVDTSIETMTGLVDGTRRSTLIMWFVPPVGRPFGASVMSPELMVEVARIAALDVPRAKAVFTVHTVHATTDSHTVSRQYVLNELEPAGPPAVSESEPDLFGLE